MTRHYHADVDTPWLELLRPTVGVSDYLELLVRMYGLVAPFESACKYTPGLVHHVDGRLLIRAGLIAQDLLALGLSPQQVATVRTCPAITVFRSVPEALGWLYLVERSTIALDGVRRHLVRQLPLVEHASAYLAAYDAHASVHWSAFGRVLDRVGKDPAVADDIVRAAHDAFGACRGWLHATKPESRSA